MPIVASDETAIDEVRSSMNVQGIMPKHDYRSDLAVGLIQNAALCVTMKHHPIIFAMAATVPTISMAFDDYYHHKNYGAMKIFHQEDYLIKCAPQELAQQLYDKTRDACDNRVEIAESIAKVIEELRPMSGEVIKKYLAEQ